MTNVEPVGFIWPDPVAVCIDVVTIPYRRTPTSARAIGCEDTEGNEFCVLTPG